MTRLAGEVEFSHGRGRTPMTIDGEPFPYYIADPQTIEVDPTTGIYTIHLALLADHVSVDLRPSEEANRAIDESLARHPLETT